MVFKTLGPDGLDLNPASATFKILNPSYLTSLRLL